MKTDVGKIWPGGSGQGSNDTQLCVWTFLVMLGALPALTTTLATNRPLENVSHAPMMACSVPLSFDNCNCVRPLCAHYLTKYIKCQSEALDKFKSLMKSNEWVDSYIQIKAQKENKCVMHQENCLCLCMSRMLNSCKNSIMYSYHQWSCSYVNKFQILCIDVEKSSPFYM